MWDHESRLQLVRVQAVDRWVLADGEEDDGEVANRQGASFAIVVFVPVTSGTTQRRGRGGARVRSGEPAANARK
jgi:hypothetical protein